MSFYRKYMGSLVEAPNGVQEADFELLAQNHKDYTYPIDGWHWFDTHEQAVDFFNAVTTPMVTVDLAKQFIQKYLDEVASAKGYGDDKTSPSISIVSYYNDINPVFAREASDFKEWRSKVWTACYSYLSEIQAGRMSPPKDFEQLRSMLPVITWSVHVPTVNTIVDIPTT